MEYNQSEFLIETEVPVGELIISRTDTEGVITYANETFVDISGYTLGELVGNQHSMVRHPDMPKRIFKELWAEITANKQWVGVVKNLRKDGGFYWVKAIVSGIYKENQLVGYKSQRTPITSEEKLKYQRLYDKMRAENNENIRTVSYK